MLGVLYQRLRKTGLIVLGFIFLALQLLDALPLTLLVRAILLLRTSSIHAAIELAIATYSTCRYKKRSCAVKGYAWEFLWAVLNTKSDDSENRVSCMHSCIRP